MTIHFVVEGDGTPVVALHGFTPDHRLMSGCLEPVFARREGFRRLYPDLPGMGLSPAPAEIAGSEDVLAVVHDFIDKQVGEQPFLLIGESWGGYLARAVTRDRPGQVLGLALICPVGSQVDLARRRVPEHVVLRPDPDLLATLEPDVAAEFAAMQVVQSPETVRRFLEEVLPGIRLADPEALLRIGAGYELSAAPETGKPYERPTLIITGRQDSVVGYEDQFDLLPHYPHASYAVLDVAGHNLQFEQPVLFEALVEEWLERVAHSQRA